MSHLVEPPPPLHNNNNNCEEGEQSLPPPAGLNKDFGFCLRRVRILI
ncbi:rCG52176, isoform CRA_c [Rattus norvegicus]|uniref:RCG52176, isoform CRA_c n=1 Tax=Rattus norvegicus TaxID=10116 RepID=A6K6N8_RAT|nr:rCG52176, isoform CRA_c [Rattus norvegicus]